MSAEKELTEFMKKKNREARGDIDIEVEVEEDTIKDPAKSVNQESTETDARAAKALAMARTILNMLFIVPLGIAIIALGGYILIKFLPATLYFIKKFFLLMMNIN